MEIGTTHIRPELRNQTLSYVGTRLAVLGVVGLLAGYGIALSITGRLKSLTDQAAKVSSGDLSTPEEMHGEQEISSLSTAFNQVVAFLNRYIVSSSTGAIITLDDDANVTSFNPTAEVVLGRRSEEVSGRPLWQALPPAPENSELIRRVTEALKNRRPFAADNINLVTNEGRSVPISLSVSFLAGRGAQTAGVLISFHDVEEIRRLRGPLMQAHGLVTLGGLAAEIAHQFRTPLASISTLLQLLREDIPPGDKRLTYINAILRSSERLDHLIDDLLRLAAPGRRLAEPCNLTALTKDVVAVAQARFNDRPVKLEENYPPDPAIVQGDRDNLAQVLINLVTNAYQAAPDGGEVRVAIRYDDIAPAQPDKPPGEPRRAVVDVFNTGSFITPEVRAKLFTPFFTTKRGGSGLGLCIAQKIVREHHGAIQIESFQDRGTTFRVMLPIQQPI